MADYSPTASRTSVSKIPMRSASTRKHATYDRSGRRYDLKYRGPSTPDALSTTSTRSPTLTPSTSGNTSPDVPAKIIRDRSQLKTNIPKTSPAGPAVSRSTLQPTTSGAPTTSTSKLAKFPRRALTTSTFTPPSVVRTPEQLKDSEDIYTLPDPLLHQTQALLHAELETLMQALHLRLYTAPHLSTSYVQAFEDLAADTLYSGMGSRILAAIEYRRAGKSEDRKRFVGTLESHLLREAAKNTRRCNRGFHFFEQHDAKSTVTEVRRLQISEDERLTTSSLTDESEWLAELEREYVHGLVALNKCTCDTYASDMEQLIAEYWAAVQRGYAAVQEAEMRMRGQDWLGHGLALENAYCGRGLTVAEEGILSGFTGDWVSTDSERDEQGADVEQDSTEDGSRWVAKVDTDSLDQKEDEFRP